LLNDHVTKHPSKTSPPFFLAFSGPQGSGKSTLVEKLATVLRAGPHNLNVVVFSVDDLYLTNSDQNELRELDPDNKLLSHRGEPGTHDIHLGHQVFDSLREQKETKIPAYDKSAFNGRGDRIHELQWKTVEPPYDLVIFEGWCVGFRALPDEEVEKRWRKSRDKEEGALGKHALEHLLFINSKLRDYDQLTNSFHALVHLDARDISYVYKWRLEQEHALIISRGLGMEDDQVLEFIEGYMPGYELYVDTLRNGCFREKGKQLRLVLAKDRSIMKAKII